MLYKFEEWPQILDKKDSQIVSGHFFYEKDVVQKE